jgi:hypothetical protein
MSDIPPKVKINVDFSRRKLIEPAAPHQVEKKEEKDISDVAKSLKFLHPGFL